MVLEFTDNCWCLLALTLSEVILIIYTLCIFFFLVLYHYYHKNRRNVFHSRMVTVEVFVSVAVLFRAQINFDIFVCFAGGGETN